MKRAGETCNDEGRYCAQTVENDYWYPCNEWNLPSDETNTTIYKGCYFGRGPLQVGLIFI